MRSFRLAATMRSCECLRGEEKSRERLRVVEAAAVRFRAAVVEKTLGFVQKFYNDPEDFVQEDLNVTPQVCQEVLTDWHLEQSRHLSMHSRSSTKVPRNGPLRPLGPVTRGSKWPIPLVPLCSESALASWKRSWL